MIRIGIGDVSLLVRQWRSRWDFVRFIEQAEHSLELSSGHTEPAVFSTLSLQSEPDGQTFWTVGVSSEDHGITPEIIAFPETKQLIIGADDVVYFLSWQTRSLVRKASLGFLFHSFVVDRERSLILAVHETGLAALSINGDQRWNLVRDVVEAVHVEGDRLDISFMDKAPVSVAIESGEEVYV